MGQLMDDALETLLADLTTSGLRRPRVQPSDWQSHQPSESATLHAPDGSGMGVWLDLGRTEPGRLAHLADQVQEWAVEELGRMRLPTNWPRCPSHPDTHPMIAQVRARVAVWVCPSHHAGAWPVGTLG